MKSVMISIKPYWVFLIIAKTMGWNIDKEKTVEVRKTYPQDDEWNKVGKIYCTKDKKSFNHIPKKYQPFMKRFLGKVIGEFICDDLFCVGARASGHQYIERLSCLSQEELIDYQGDRVFLWGWHISNLVIYDTPKVLGEFEKPCNHNCFTPCPHYRGKEYECEKPIITRPPQSWCYVEEKEEV